jgi:uncharacterized membrane protein YeaQ/YmgE (transglycosylase-associated protein family)
MLAILWWLVIGLIAGVLARVIIPGRQHMSLLMMVVLGLVGSLVGGLLCWIFDPEAHYHPAGLLMSIVGAVLLLGIYVLMGLTRPMYS